MTDRRAWLEDRIWNVLNKECTGVDDHDSAPCPKCRRQSAQLAAVLDQSKLERGYAVELFWGWGRDVRFSEVERFHVDVPEDVDRYVRAFIPRMVNRYAFDCDRLEHPLYPWLHGLRITPVGQGEYRDTKAWDAIVEAAVTEKERSLQAKRP